MTRNALDVRNLIERFEELEGELAEIDSDNAQDAVNAWYDSDDGHEFKQLSAFFDQLADSGGDHQWRGSWYPITLIPEYEFKEYAEELAEELGLINDSAGWPNNCIDWEQAARELQQDYSQAEYDGVTYYYRS